MALIVQSDLEARLSRSLTTAEASAFTIINAAIQSYVEQFIGSGVESVSATSRYYDGGVQHLKIAPCTSLTALELVDDDYVVVDTYDTTDYAVEPTHKTLKTMLRHRSGAFTTGLNNLKVTAKFSIFEDTATLNIVKNAMLSAMVSELTNSKNITKESIEGYSVEFGSTEAMASLAPIKYLFPEVI